MARTRTCITLLCLSLALVATTACGSASVSPTAPASAILSNQAGAIVATTSTGATSSGGGVTTATASSSSPTASSGATSATGNDDQDTQEIEGLVTAIPPTTSVGQFRVGSTTIVTAAGTTFTLNDHTGLFADIAVGVRVHVKGTINIATGAVAARVVMIQNTVVTPSPSAASDDGGDHEAENTVEVRGALTAASGACPALRLTLGSTVVTTSAATRFDVACATLVVGRSVEVKGTRNADGTISALRIARD